MPASSKRSPDGAQRNPGFSYATQQPRISLSLHPDYLLAADDFSRLAVPRTLRKHPPMPIVAPPFHAVPLCAGITGTMGGVEINAHAQALKPDGSAFAGLYAVGTPVAGLEGGPRVGYVGGLSKAFILGLLAAEHMAAERIAATRMAAMR